MSSRVWSALDQLDKNLQTIQSQVERLRSGLDVSDDQLLRGSLRDACERAAVVRDLVGSERPDADWSDRESLDLLVVALEDAARERLKQQRRERLLAVAKELEAGSVRHRFESRTAALDGLRLEAVAQLRAKAAEPEQPNELPGPEPRHWLHWACNLDDTHDAAVLAQLRRDFAALDRFAMEIEEAYWLPASLPQLGAAAESTLAANPSPGEDSREVGEERPPSLAGVPPLNAIIAIGSTAIRGEARLAPLRQALPATSIQSTGPSRESRTSEEAPSGPATVAMPTFGEIASTERHAAPWLVVAAIIVLIILFAAIYHFHTRNNPGPSVVAAGTPAPERTQVSQTEAAATSPSSLSAADSQQSRFTESKPASAKNSPIATIDPKAEASLLHKQAAEGTQDNIGLSVESCARVNTQNIECWGYLSNLRGNESKIGLYRVNAVDGKGNSFDLTSGADHGFSSHDFKVPARSRVKYSVKVPDTDPGARTLTLYLDVNNPRAVEYTFRDVPIAE